MQSVENDGIHRMYVISHSCCNWYRGCRGVRPETVCGVVTFVVLVCSFRVIVDLFYLVYIHSSCMMTLPAVRMPQIQSTTNDMSQTGSPPCRSSCRFRSGLEWQLQTHTPSSYLKLCLQSHCHGATPTNEGRRPTPERDYNIWKELTIESSNVAE